MDTAAIERLFSEYEKAFSNLDFEKNAELFSDQFISAGPKGVIAQSKMDFMQKASQAADFYRSVGQTSARIISKNIIPISDEYAMVTVHWAANFQKTGDKDIEFDVTYIVHLAPEPRIILFIAHQDEEEAMKKLGLVNKAFSQTN